MASTKKRPPRLNKLNLSSETEETKRSDTLDTLKTSRVPRGLFITSDSDSDSISKKIIELNPSSSDFIIDFVNNRIRERISIEDETEILKFSNKLKDNLNRLSEKDFNMFVSCRDTDNKPKSCLFISPFSIKASGSDSSSSKGSFGSISQIDIERDDTMNDPSKLSFITILKEIFSGKDFVFSNIQKDDDIISKEIVMSKTISVFMNDYIRRKKDAETEDIVYVFNPMIMMKFFIIMCIYELAISMIAADKGIGPKIYGAFMELSETGEFVFQILMENLEPITEKELKEKKEELVELLQKGIFTFDPHPGNVMKAKDGTIRLIDFALSVDGDVSEELSERLADGFVKKTFGGFGRNQKNKKRIRKTHKKKRI
jgi:hypothetical protein